MFENNHLVRRTSISPVCVYGIYSARVAEKAEYIT